MSRILRVENRGPLKTSVSRRAAFQDDNSYINLIVGLKKSAKSTNVFPSSAGISHRENVVNESFGQTNGLIGLASKSRSSKSAM